MSDIPSQVVHIPECTQAKLKALYQENGFDTLLHDPKRCKRTAIVPRRPKKPEETFHSSLIEYEEGAKFHLLSEDGRELYTIAVIFWYTDVTGAVTEVIRSLRIGTNVHDAVCKP
jgi:hypothetical protein